MRATDDKATVSEEAGGMESNAAQSNEPKERESNRSEFLQPAPMPVSQGELGNLIQIHTFNALLLNCRTAHCTSGGSILQWFQKLSIFQYILVSFSKFSFLYLWFWAID